MILNENRNRFQPFWKKLKQYKTTGSNLENLPYSERKEILDWADAFEEWQYDKAISIVDKTSGTLPEGYSFSHYVIRGAGSQVNIDSIEGAIRAIQEETNGSRLEITAIYKSPNREFIEKSILYLNLQRGAAYLDGKPTDSKIDVQTLMNSMLAHN